MNNIDLANDEAVLFETDDFSFESSAWGRGEGELFLTNKRFIIIREKGLFKKTTETFFEPVDRIKIYQGEPQVKYDNGRFGEDAEMEIYFRDSRVLLTFDSENKKKAKELFYQINKLLGDPEISGMQGGESTKIFAIPGSEKFAQTIKGTISTFKDTFMEQKKGSNCCLNCGGTVTGFIGKTARCPFCGNVMEIK